MTAGIVHRSSRGTPLAMPTAREDPICVRVYKGNLGQASGDAAEHAPYMRQAGYFETNRAYTEGRWGAGAFLIALLLCLFLIGIVMLIALLIVKPDGHLVVTYERREA